MQWLIPVLTTLVGASCVSKGGSGSDSARDSGGSAHSSDGTGDDGLDGAPEIGASAFEVTGGPYDLAMHDDGRVFCSIAEDRVVAWDGEFVEEITDSIGSVRAIALVGDILYFTTSDHRQAGGLGRLIDGDVEIIATAHGSTLFREPVDLARAPDGTWVMPDPTIGLLWTVNDVGATGQIDPGTSTPRTVVFNDGALFIGGEDGIWRMDWPDGTPTEIDDRPANGLHMALGQLWAANQNDHLFVPGTDTQYAITDAAVPARMTGSGPIYMADWGRADVWVVEP